MYGLNIFFLDATTCYCFILIIWLLIKIHNGINIFIICCHVEQYFWRDKSLHSISLTFLMMEYVWICPSYSLYELIISIVLAVFFREQRVSKKRFCSPRMNIYLPSRNHSVKHKIKCCLIGSKTVVRFHFSLTCTFHSFKNLLNAHFEHCVSLAHFLGGWSSRK